MNIKINFLYLLWIAMLGIAFILAVRFINRSETTIFGAAESDGQILNTAYPVVVKKIKVQAGQRVFKGDTLMLLDRPELGKQTAFKQNEFNQGHAQRSTDIVEIDLRLAELFTGHKAAIADLQGQLSLAQAEARTQSELKKIVAGGSHGTTSKGGLLDEKIAALNKAISVEQSTYETQRKALEQQRLAQQNLNASQLSSVRTELVFLEKDKSSLVLLAPMDGYVEGILVFENEVATEFKPLLRVNPKRPNKIRGFVPESAEVVFQLGDTVQLHSLTRPAVISIGVLTGSSTSVVELPMRLRRFQSMSSWGREIYISLSNDNEYFIGEKVVIHMPIKPTEPPLSDGFPASTNKAMAKREFE